MTWWWIEEAMRERRVAPRAAFTGDGFAPPLRGPASYEHVHRYAVAAKFAAGKRVLDVAAAEGYGSALLARDADAVTGIGTDPAAIDRARLRYGAPNLRFAVGSVSDMPVETASIDVVVSFNTAEDVAECRRMLDESRRVLAPGGMMIVSSPSKLVSLDEFAELLEQRFACVMLYGQRLAACSIMHPLHGTNGIADWLHGEAEGVGAGLPALERPAYFLALCSDAPFPDRVCSAFLDPADDLLSLVSHEFPRSRRQAEEMDALRTAAQEAETLKHTASRLAHRVDELETENLRLTQRGATDRAQADATWAARLSAERVDHEETCARLVAEHQTWYARFVHEHEETRAKLVTEREEMRAQLVAEHEKTCAQLVAEHQAWYARFVDENAEMRAQLVAEHEETCAKLVAEHEETCAKLVAEHQAWYARFIDESAESRAGLVAEREAVSAALRTAEAAVANANDEIARLTNRLAAAECESVLLRDVLGSRSWHATMPLRRIANWIRRLFGGT